MRERLKTILEGFKEILKRFRQRLLGMNAEEQIKQNNIKLKLARVK